MTEDDLRKFDKEVLVQVLYVLAIFEPQRTLQRLIHYEKRERYKKLVSRRERVAMEMGGDITCAEFKAANKTLSRINSEINKLLVEQEG